MGKGIRVGEDGDGDRWRTEADVGRVHPAYSPAGKPSTSSLASSSSPWADVGPSWGVLGHSPPRCPDLLDSCSPFWPLARAPLNEAHAQVRAPPPQRAAADAHQWAAADAQKVRIFSVCAAEVLH